MLALAALVVALVSPTANGMAPPGSEPPESTAPGSIAPAATVPTIAPTFVIAVPDGYTALVDDTGVLAVVVPDSWTDTDTAPLVLDDRLTPSILAATDRDGFVTGWAGAGASLIVTPFATPNENIGRFTITSGCADGFTTRDFPPLADSAFEGTDDGLVTTATGCGPDDTGTWTIAAVNDAAQTYSLVLVVQTPTDTASDRAVVAFVLEHFGATPSAAPTDSGPGASLPVPATDGSAPVH